MHRSKTRDCSTCGSRVLSIFLERRFGIHASRTTLTADVLIVALAFTVVEPLQVLYSLLVFLCMSSVVGRYHRPPAWARAKPA